MKRTNEFAVGLAVLLALALVVAGALWLSETDVNKTEDRRPGAVPHRRRARRRRAGDAARRQGRPGRGHPAGRRTSGSRPSSASTARVELPAKPAVISASASLFGEWSANIISYDPPPDRSQPAGRARRVRPRRRRRLARRHPARHRPADRPGQPHRRRRGRGDPADQPGVRQHRAQEPAEEREGPGGDLGPAGDLRQRADHPDRPREPERRHHLRRLRRRGQDLPGRRRPARHGHQRQPAQGHPEQRPGIERRPPAGRGRPALGHGRRPREPGEPGAGACSRPTRS